MGDPPLLRTFARRLTEKWDVGHCGDDALIVICTRSPISQAVQGPGSRVRGLSCEAVVLVHGDMTKRAIPEAVRRAMERQAKNLLTFTNSTLLLHYLLSNYRTFLTNRNRTPVVDMIKLPYQVPPASSALLHWVGTGKVVWLEDLSSGVITVMVLTSFLSMAWVMCVAHLGVQILKRRRARAEAKRASMVRFPPLPPLQTSPGVTFRAGDAGPCRSSWLAPVKL